MTKFLDCATIKLNRSSFKLQFLLSSCKTTFTSYGLEISVPQSLNCAEGGKTGCKITNVTPNYEPVESFGAKLRKSSARNPSKYFLELSGYS